MLDGPKIAATARSLIEAHRTSLGIEVSTQVAYPDGELVRVVVRGDGDGFEVSDASYGMMYLSRIAIKLTSQQSQRLQRDVAQYGCELRQGRVSIRCEAQRLADAIALVANASRSVADYGVEARRLIDSDFRISVIDRLREFVGSRLRERQQVKGQSGRHYWVGGVVLDRSETRPTAFIEPCASRSIVADRFAEFFDLQEPYADVSRLAVYDDTQKWPDSDIRLLSQVSRPVRYSTSGHDFRGLAV